MIFSIWHNPSGPIDSHSVACCKFICQCSGVSWSVTVCASTVMHMDKVSRNIWIYGEPVSFNGNWGAILDGVFIPQVWHYLWEFSKGWKSGVSTESSFYDKRKVWRNIMVLKFLSSCLHAVPPTTYIHTGLIDVQRGNCWDRIALGTFNSDRITCTRVHSNPDFP
jgi:hypothetical protein